MNKVKYIQKRAAAFILMAAMVIGLLPLPAASAADYVLGSDEVIVSSATEFKTALQNTSINTIYFGANIQLTSTVTIAKRASGTLTISGTNPQTGTRYRYMDYNSSLSTTVPLQMNSGSLTNTVIFKDIDLYIYNYYGILQVSSDASTNSALTVVFDNVDGVGTQFIWLGYSTFTIRNSKLEVRYVGAQNAEEFAEIAKVRLEGEVELSQNLNGSANSNGYAFFSFNKDVGHSVTIADGAKVTAKTNYCQYGFCYFYSNTGGKATFDMGKDASFTFIGTDRFCATGDYGRFGTFTVGERSAVTLIVPTASSSGAYLWSNTINVKQGAELNIYAKNNYYSVIRTNTLNLENPRRVVLYNGGTGSAVSSDVDASLNASALKSIRYYTSAGDSYDFAAQKHNDARAGWSMQFFREEGSFNLSASKWGAATAAIGSTTYPSGGSYSAMSGANLGANGVKVVQIDGAYSEPPTVNSVMEGAIVLTGTGVPGALITASSDATGELTATVGSDGSWQAVSAIPFVGGETVTVTQTESLFGYLKDKSEAVTTVVQSLPVRLIAENNTQKTYSGDTLYVNVSPSIPSGFSIVKVEYVVFDDPDMVFDPLDSALFDSEFASAGKSGEVTCLPNAEGSEFSGTVGQFQNNCAVWVRATVEIDGTVAEFFDTLSYRNLFTRYPVMVRGAIAGSYPIDLLYDYTAVEGDYGIPYMGDGRTVYGNPVGGFDTVELNIREFYRNHWTAKLGGNPAPYLLTLDGSFLAGNTLCDSGNPAKYTLDYIKTDGMWWDSVMVYYIDGAGNALTLDGQTSEQISVPLTEMNGSASKDFYALGGRYTPPENENYSPAGWVAASSYTQGDAYTAQNNFNEDGFDPQFNDVDGEYLFIIYKTGQFKVTEHYRDEAGNTLHQDSSRTYDPLSPTDYESRPPAIIGYVPVGYTVSGSSGGNGIYDFSLQSGTNPAANQYDLFPTLTIPGSQLIPAEGSNVIVTYTYAADSNYNGIPDDEETAVTVKWRGYSLGGLPQTVLPSVAFATRVGYEITVSNDYPQLGIGDTAHTIASGDGAWIFDLWYSDENTASRTVTPGTEPVEIVFIYSYASDGETPDKRQYVTEEFYALDAGESNETDTGSSIAIATTHYILKTQAYEKTPPVISGYVYIGYRIEDEYGNPVGGNEITYVNGEAPSAVSVRIASNPERYRVVYLYRTAAKPVAVTWLGTTYAGNSVVLGSTVKSGYVGERITVYAQEQDIGESWILSGTYLDDIQQNDGDSLEITLGDNIQSARFVFRETANSVTIKVRYQSDDGNIDFSIRNETVMSGSPVEVNAFSLSGYELTGWRLTDSQDEEISSGSSANLPEKIYPSQGSQTLTLVYKSTRVGLYIRCYDDATGREIEGTAQKIDGLDVDSRYAAVAPAVPGYALVSGEPLIKNVTVEKGTNLVSFRYEKITGGTLILREAVYGEGGVLMEDQGTIIAYLSLNAQQNELIPIPNLVSFYYTSVSAEEKTYTGDTIVHYYDKDMMDVEIRAVDASDPQKILESRTVAVRKGENYLAVMDFTVADYVLSDTAAKYIYADPEDSALTVSFAFKEETVSSEITSGSLTILTADASDGSVISGASITVKNAAGDVVFTGQTGSGGMIVLSDVDFDVYTVSVSADGYNSAAVTKTVSASEPYCSVLIALSKPSTGGGTTIATQTSLLTVRGCDESGKILYSETVTKTVGDVVTVEAREVADYILNDTKTKKITIAIDSGENLLVFLYKTEDAQENRYPRLETEAHIAYINGYKDGTVRPDANITRAEAAIIFYRLISEVDKTEPLAPSFNDIPAGAWYAQAVAYLEKHGIITGYTDGSFKPNASLTRAELVAIASRFDSLTGGGVTFTGVPAGHWAEDYIANAQARGWINGYPNGTFRPDQNITRAETVTVVNAMLGRKINAEALAGVINPYGDLKSGHWAYGAIMEASMGHDYVRDEHGAEIWQ